MARSKDITLAKSMGLAIRQLRKKKYPNHGGQIKCAADFGVSQSEWSRWERGIKAPSAGNQKKIADFFSVPIGVLWGEEEKKPGEEGPRLPAGAAGGGAKESLRLYRLGMDIQMRVSNVIHYGEIHPETVREAIAALEIVKRTLDRIAPGMVAGILSHREEFAGFFGDKVPEKRKTDGKNAAVGDADDEIGAGNVVGPEQREESQTKE